VGLAWGCREASNPVTVPLPVFDVSSPPALRPGYLIVCKDTPRGTSGTFQVDAWIQYPDGTEHSVGIYINSGECKPLVVSQPDPTVQVLENLGNGSPGWQLASVTVITDAGTVQLSGNNIGTVLNPAVCSIDFTHGCIIVFHNVPTTTPPPPPSLLPGRMTGGGVQISIGNVSISRGFTIHCDIILSNNIEINWPGNKWHLDKPITSATCIDDPTISPQPPPAPFDTFIGKATGRLNGVDGSRLEFTFVDAGEPGRKDKSQLRIFAPNGTVVLDVPLGFLDHGNLQAHYDQPHK
jgi:hypothetical protein